MKIFTVEYVPKYTDDLVLAEERSVSLSIEKALECVDFIRLGNNTGRIFVEVWEDGKLTDSEYFPIALCFSNINQYLKGFTS